MDSFTYALLCLPYAMKFHMMFLSSPIFHQRDRSPGKHPSCPPPHTCKTPGAVSTFAMIAFHLESAPCQGEGESV